MPGYAEICDLVKKLGSRNVYEICRQKGILLHSLSMGGEPTSVKGFFFEVSRTKCIVINSDQPSLMQRIVLAHELGHAFLHCSGGVFNFRETSLFGNADDMEREANLFAGELLLDDGEVLTVLETQETLKNAARALMVPKQLLDFKLRVMRWKGQNLAETTYRARNDFLGYLEVFDGDDINSIC